MILYALQRKYDKLTPPPIFPQPFQLNRVYHTYRWVLKLDQCAL